MAFRWPLFKQVMIPGVSSTSMRRPCEELMAALNVFSEPSGVVPGTGEDGRGSSSLLFGNSGGPNCFIQDICRVLCVKSRDHFVIVLFPPIPFVTCTAADN
jgi:hypothetical protein